jgi:hypothetical protein
MAAPADLVVTQLSVEGGEAQESADFITVSRPASLWPLRRRTDQFCALLAPDRPGQGALCRQVLDVMEREFASSGGRSATSALSTTLLAGHQFLRRENSLSMPEDRVRLQVAAAILRGGGAYLGRVGPTFAIVRHGSTLQKFSGIPPSPTGSLDPHDPSRLLGGEQEPNIAYTFSPFVPNDLLALASGPYWEQTRPDYLEAALDEGEPSAVASALYELGVWRQTRPTFSILVVEARLPERRGFMGRAAAPEDSDNGHDEMADASPDAEAHYGYGRPRRLRGDTAVDDWGHDEFDDAGRGTATATRVRRPQTLGRPPRGGTRTQSANGRASAPRGLPFLDPGTLDRWTRGTIATLPPRALLVGLMALALVVLVVLGFTLVQILRPPPDPGAALAAGAQSIYDQTRRAPDAPSTRDQLDEARQLLVRALAIRDEPAWRSLLGDVQTDLDRLDKVVRLPNVPPLIDLSGLDGGTSVTRVIVEGTDVYVLDVGGARLFRYQLQADGSLQSAEPTVLAKRDDQVAGRAVGRLITMAWVPAGAPRTDPGLVVVESGRQFLTYNPRAGLGRLVPADSSRWAGIAAMAGYQGKVYLVDPDRQTLLEYMPTRTGYDSSPTAPLDGRTGIAWERIVDVAVDGSSIYLLQGDGVLRKFTRERGEPQSFSGQIPDSLRAPISLTLPTTTNDARVLYVADAGNDRVVQLQASGAYDRQFRVTGDGDSLKNMRDVFVDPNNRLYVLTTKALYRFELPAE